MDPKRVESYNQIKMCICVDVYGGYIGWLIKFYFVPGKHISLLKLGNIFAREQGLSYSSLFFLFRRTSEYPLFSISRTLVHFSTLFSFFMNNFFITPCLFSATKL